MAIKEPQLIATSQGIQQVQSPVSENIEIISYPHEKLLESLYWIYDVFERSNMNFFLVYSTAEKVLQKRQLEGDKVEIGVRRLEWENGSRDLFDTYMQDEGIEAVFEDDRVFYRSPNGIPLIIYLFDDHICVRSLDQVPYENEYFQMPNPYSQFMEVFRK